MKKVNSESLIGLTMKGDNLFFNWLRMIHTMKRLWWFIYLFIIKFLRRVSNYNLSKSFSWEHFLTLRRFSYI